MDKKTAELLEKITFPNDKIHFFNDVKIDKIIVQDEKKKWDIYFKSKQNIPYLILEELLDYIAKFVKNNYVYQVFVEAQEEDLTLFADYYNQALIIANNNNVYHDMFHDRLRLENAEYFVEVYNKSEEQMLNKKLTLMNKLLNKYGYKTGLKIKYNLDTKAVIQKEITNDLDTFKEEIVKKVQKKAIATSNILFGNIVKGKVTPIEDITYEIDNVTVEGMVFGIVPSNKKGFYSFNIKITDLITSMYVRVFANSEEVYNDLLGKIKSGMWLKINGYVKNNTFYNDFVLNARNIETFVKEEKQVEDLATEKRVELHAHTKMSQMDGVVDLADLVKRASNWGHKAIAITDHNAIQVFPEAAKLSKKHDIKIIYGVELAMIDDDLDLVFRPDDSNLLDNTYVVFDLETTGFNAAVGDTIIEVGAVKITNGEIIDRFDKLINPGRQIPPHITEITSITDDMVKDCDDEETVIKEFKEWVGNLPMVAHNAKFDASFVEMAYQKYNLGPYNNILFDTLQISRALEPDVFRHSLSALVKRYEVPWDEDHHHRADYDSEATAIIFHKMLKKLENKKILKTNEVDQLVSKEDIHKFGNIYHINLLVKNQVGLKNLFKLVSLSNTKYLYKTPRILRSEVERLREGLLISSGCASSEIFTLARSKSDEELSDLMNFYDIVEVQSPEVYSYLIDLEDFNSEKELLDNIEKIIRLAKNKKKMIVASGDVHHLDRSDKIYREIIANQKVPGGGRHPLNRPKIKQLPSQHFRTTDEMLLDFAFLGKEIAYEIVVTNTNEVASIIEEINIIPDTKGIPFSPIIENSEKLIKEICYEKAHEIYGDPLPEIIKERLDSELNGIINGGFDTIYLIAQKLVKKSNDDGYTVGSRGSVGSSFVATMLNVSEVNPLPAHYVCPSCKTSIFNDDMGEPLAKEYPSGYDMPDKLCSCNVKMNKEGQDMPFATFLGFNADKVPDIDLNFSGEYQSIAHDYTKVLFGEDHVFRAGTIGTVAEKTAFGFTKGYYEDRQVTNIKSLEIERLSMGVTGVKRTTGQHPGGIVVVPNYKEVFDFTPYQYPADDTKAPWFTTHFNYHDIEDCLLKLDILGHDNPTFFKMLDELTGVKEIDIPMDDKEVMSLFTSTKALKVTPAEINCEVGCANLPEFTRFVIGIVMETKPTTFAELVKISGLSHGTDVWNGNAQELVRNGVCEFKNVIGCRDDIMVYLINAGLEPIDAFKIMELVRKGNALKDKDLWAGYKQKMKDKKVPDWYIDSCEKIKYMFPKAHATAYITAAYRIAWFKINYPIEYYATHFSIKSFAFDLEVMEMGTKKIKERLEELGVRKFGLTVKEQDLLSNLEVALEMTARGFNFGPIDLMKSDAFKFIIDEDKKTLIPPFRALEGLGGTVANNIVNERAKGIFLSIDDLQKRGKLSSTLIEKMRMMGILKGLPESSQLSLFDEF